MYDYAPKLDKDMRNTAGSIEQIEDRENHKFEPWNFVQTESDPVCASSGCWHSAWFKHQQDKIVGYPDPMADGFDSDVSTTLKNEAAASASTGHTWDPWAGASNAPKPKEPLRVRSIAEIMEYIAKGKKHEE